MIAVTHLLGAGHLTRAASLARAFSRQGHETTLVSGGSPVRLADLERVTFVQIPSVRTVGTDFKTLLDDDLAKVDASYLERRQAHLLDTLTRVRPDILVTELFPFGRRVLADEFSALLKAARDFSPPPLILSSIRDILVPSSKASRIADAHERVLRDYDAVLVHGNPELVPLEASWPVDERIRPLIRYTGYVDENEAIVPQVNRHGIVISGGSSAASLPLYRAAIKAAPGLAEKPWRILVGRGIGEADFRALQSDAPAHVAVERARPDFRILLAAAELSVSQAGYNTIVDILRSGVKSVLVPFEAGHETEQRLRAERLRTLGRAEILAESELSPQSLVNAIRRGLKEQSPTPPAVSTDGARRSVAIAEGLVQAGPAIHPRIDWSPMDRALERARDQGVPVRFWWRDDDAVADTPKLDRLLSLMGRHEAGIGLAVIPNRIEASLAARLEGESGAFAFVHGWSHANHAPDQEKKAEFGARRSLETMTAQAEQALLVARKNLGSKLLPVFVPPWNRISQDLVPHLPRLGFAGLSTFTDRKAAQPAAGLIQLNTHVDPIDWHGTKSLADPARIVQGLAGAIERRISEEADPNEPIGFLTHHLVHDDVIWSLCERLIAHLAARGIRFLRPDACFSMETRSHLRSNGA